jgi:hypothetical protein
VTPRAVPAGEIDDWLPRIAWHLAEFAANGATTPDELIADLRDRQRQLWLVDDDGDVLCALLTQVMGDRLWTVRVTHCAGRDYERWLDLWPVIEEWAREIGSKRIEALARPGWQRPLKAFGMVPTHVLLERRL